MSEELNKLLEKIRQCKVCKKNLPLEPNPVLRASETAKILIIGQAPGIRVHNSNIPWNDPSGDRLREWMQLDKETFYDESKIAIVPMGFCYPGTGKTGDLPPRKECAPLWHEELLEHMPEIKLILLIGNYSQSYYLKDKKTLTERVKDEKDYSPYFPLPHPSPRNNIWMKKNQWFEKKVLPDLRKKIKELNLN